MKDFIYEEPFKRINFNDQPIDFLDLKLGRNVKIGNFVVIDKNCILGNNVFIGHGTVIRNNVVVGDNSIIGHLVVIESNVLIGDNVTIQSQCHITKGAVIEDWVFFGPKAMCINTLNISHGRKYSPKLKAPIIRKGARIGSGAVIFPEIEIGREVLIGANSTVTSNCDSFGVYIGNPARRTRDIPEYERYEGI